MNIELQSFTAECEKLFQDAKTIFDTLTNKENSFSDEEFLKQNNELDITISNLSSLTGLFTEVHPDAEVRDLAEKFEQKLTEFTTTINLNRDLYERFVRVDLKSFDLETQRCVNKNILDFRRSGVDKPFEIREKVKQLRDELVLLGQEFSRNVRSDVRSIEVDAETGLMGLPLDYRAAHTPDANGNVKITTDYPDAVPFLRYATSSHSREALSFQFKNRGYPKNMEVLSQLLSKRFELAHLLGYENWAEYVTEDKMIKNSQNIEKFLIQLDRATYQKSKEEYALLLEAKRKDFPNAQSVNGWESEYYEEKVKQEKFAFDSQSVRPYFEYNRVKEGIMQTMENLFAMSFHKIVANDVWHESVESYDVFESGQKIGRIYLDMHPRENKYKHAAQFSIKNGVKGYQLPEGALVCNFTDPKNAQNGIALLDHNEVTTFFHEFGHLMHFILSGRHTWERLSGIAVEWDFVEAPSQFLEEWAWEVDVLQSFARHYETNEPIPAELVAKMRAADEFGKALFVKQQTFYSAISLFYYNQDPSHIDTTALLQELQHKYSMFSYVEGTHMQASFEHLIGYSAIYCTYMWSLVIAKDLLSPFLQKGMMDKDVAERYKVSILEKGGTQDAMDMIHDFLGREYSFDSFKRWLEK